VCILVLICVVFLIHNLKGAVIPYLFFDLFLVLSVARKISVLLFQIYMDLFNCAFFFSFSASLLFLFFVFSFSYNF